MKFKATCLIANKPNYNGRIYSEELIEDAISDAKLFEKEFSIKMETNSGVSAFKLVDIEKEVHLSEVRYIGVFETLNNLGGEIVTKMLNDDFHLAIATIGYGRVKSIENEDETKDTQNIIKNINNVSIVENYSLTEFNIIAGDDYNSEYKIYKI